MDEYIKREAAMDIVRRTSGDYAAAFAELRRLPAADVAPVQHGRWLDGKCTVCGWEEPDVGTWDGYDAEAWIETPYCPNCGANM